MTRTRTTKGQYMTTCHQFCFKWHLNSSFISKVAVMLAIINDLNWSLLDKYLYTCALMSE